MRKCTNKLQCGTDTVSNYLLASDLWCLCLNAASFTVSCGHQQKCKLNKSLNNLALAISNLWSRKCFEISGKQCATYIARIKASRKQRSSNEIHKNAIGDVNCITLQNPSTLLAVSDDSVSRKLLAATKSCVPDCQEGSVGW